MRALLCDTPVFEYADAIASRWRCSPDKLAVEPRVQALRHVGHHVVQLRAFQRLPECISGYSRASVRLLRTLLCTEFLVMVFLMVSTL